jgi:hypothetical protein
VAGPREVLIEPLAVSTSFVDGAHDDAERSWFWPCCADDASTKPFFSHYKRRRYLRT